MKHAGFTIQKNEDGYYWLNGESNGYFDTVEEAKASIDQFNTAGDDENIYGLAGIRQSIEEDRRSNF